jgi:cell division protein FtsI (penicillin-binding protein 3)
VAGCSRAVASSHPARRLTAVLVVYLLVTALIGWRLVTVQVVAAAEYRSLAQRQAQREIALPARRGKLYDRAGEPLAMSLAAATIYANPRAMTAGGGQPSTVAARLARVLDTDAERLALLLAKDTSFVYLARQLPREVGDEVLALGLPGVGVLEEPTRRYPAGALAAQVLGFAGVDNTGLAGLEAQYDGVLSGKPGRLRVERAPGGLTISAAPREVQPAVAGADVVLTLDRQIQSVAERALSRALETYKAQGGSAIVLDARTGEVLAMASVPGFAPEDSGRADPYLRRNRAVTDVFEPGSVNKAITAAAALEEGLVTPGELFTVPDTIQVGRRHYSDAHPHATKAMSFAEIIAESSNVGAIQVAQRLGDARLHAYLRRFGYGRPSGLEFLGESAGLLPDPSGWWESSLPTIAIGQGVSATLLQVAQVFQTIASDGERVEPTLVRGTVGPDGRLDPVAPPARERVVSPGTARAVAAMLVGVVEGKSGTGGLAAIPGYHVGGKTGTAQKPLEDARGYQEGAYIGSFAGYAPADDPALVAAVMLDEPTPIWGGVTAAPVFREIMGFALQHRRIPPSDPNVPPAPQPAPASPAAISPTP